MKYKFIFCIISSKELPTDNLYFNSNEKYKVLKGYISKYFKPFESVIKYFFVEFDNSLSNEIQECDEYIYVKGEESLIPGILNKCQKAFKYINDNYDYDFLIRTNLSSVWNFKNLLMLYDKLPKYNLFGGHVVFNQFVSGTGLFISKDVTYKLLKEKPYKCYDDVVISRIASRQKIPFYELNESTCHKLNYQIEDSNCTDINSQYHFSNNLIPNDIENILYFRVKPTSHEKAIYLTKLLIKQMYDLDLDILT
jgi:hypothetical protein